MSTPTPSAVEVSIEEQVATVTLNRPEVRNAIDDAMRAELIGILDRLGSDDAVRAIVITGKGKAFCAGGDIAGMQQAQCTARRDRLQRLAAPATHQGISVLHGLGKPTIAAVNGPAMGLGCDMALCCDFIMASEAAVFGMSFILRGLVSDGGGLYFLPRRVGLPRQGADLHRPQRAGPGGADDRARRSVASPDTCCRKPGPGPSSSAADHPRAPHQVDPGSDLRAPRGAGLRSRPRGAGDLLHHPRASGIRRGVPEQDEPVGSTATWKRSIACSAHAASRSSVLRRTRRS